MTKTDISNTMEEYFDRLWPLCRSITGNGLRDSLKILQEIIPLQLHEVPSGTKVFDWEVPEEWNIQDAYIITPDGKKIADFKKSNLHVVNYSIPIDKELTFEELDAHLHYRKHQPDAVPYVSSYYNRNWGFCLQYNTYKELPREGKYRVKIASRLEKGSLTYGDLVLKGQSEKELFFTSYLCHPSMAINELSGPLALAFLYNELKNKKDRYYTYRFVLAPETIGALCYLHRHGLEMKNKVQGGYIFTCCGDGGPIIYKKSREEYSQNNKITEHVLHHSGDKFDIIPFDPIGSDERQYGSPGFNLPIGTLMRTPFSAYPEYHSSLDNKELMNFKSLADFVQQCVEFVQALELNHNYENQIQYGEPFLNKRNLYEDLSTKRSHSDTIHMRMRLLNFLDGTNELVDICNRYGYSILSVESEIKQLLEHDLIRYSREKNNTTDHGSTLHVDGYNKKHK
jgi:aminopeptidase-like protein